MRPNIAPKDLSKKSEHGRDKGFDPFCQGPGLEVLMSDSFLKLIFTTMTLLIRN